MKRKKVNFCKCKKILSDEHKENIRRALKGRVFTDEWKEKIRQSKIGTKHSSEVKERLSKIHTGKKMSKLARLKISGSNNHFWKGGIAAEPYCDVWLDEEFKESIRERDNHECQNPDCEGTYFEDKLSVHHIDYVKKHCHPDNLISLCRCCNTQANSNRKYWQVLYSNLREVANAA